MPTRWGRATRRRSRTSRTRSRRCSSSARRKGTRSSSAAPGAAGGGEEAPRANALEEAGEWTSGRERDAMKIERDADAVARCFLLERELFEGGFEREWDGEVTGVIGAGAFVSFAEGHEGLLAVRRLRGDWWELNEEGTIL